MNCQTGTEAVWASQADLIRAYLAGYWQAVEDFGAYADRGRAQALPRSGNDTVDRRSSGSTSRDHAAEGQLKRDARARAR